WNDPYDLYDALQMAIMDPIVSLSEYVLAYYSLAEFVLNNEPGFTAQNKIPKLYRLPFDIPKAEHPKLLEWSYSNARTLWNIGHKAAEDFIAKMTPKIG